MKHAPFSDGRGSALVITLVTLAALSFMAAYTLLRSVPKVHMAYQNAAWQEARTAAESGIDAAMNDLLLNATGFSPGAWTGWKDEKPASSQGTPSSGGLLSSLLNPVLSLTQTTVQTLLGKIALSGATSSTTASGTSVSSGTALYLDNVRLSSASSLPTEVDIRLWSLQPNANPNLRWFRIRSMGTCALPTGAKEPPANLDAHLRRFSLRTVRPSVQRDDAGQPSTIPLPNVSRTIEVLVEPVMSFELALWTGQTLNLPFSGTWNVDSFDSSDPKKSNANGTYPGRGSPLVQANGDIASGTPHTPDWPYGPTIAANGARVSGAAATDGGDDPATKEHENASGTFAIDPARIHDDFNRQMIPLLRPSGEYLAPPAQGSFVPGPEGAPTIYSVHGSLTDLQISPPASGNGAIVLLVDGNLDLANPLVIPPSVIAILFVRGQITFHDNVNSGAGNSNRASQLMIFGDGTDYQNQTLRVLSTATVTAAYYGPRTDATLDGTVNWIGSLNASSFRVSGGGDGGIHYDEGLATVGPVIGFRIARYIEDVRE